jgi:hypothetical protein
LNNYTEEQYQAILAVDCRYVVCGKEVGESQTPHIQGFIAFANAKSLSAVSKILFKAHCEVKRGSFKEASDYCKKEGPFEERGTLPLDELDKGDAEKKRWADAILAVKENRVEDVDPQILCTSLKKIEYAVERIRAVKRKIDTLDVLEHRWYVGETGTGKSRSAREEFPDAYIKDPMERWWDGYIDQEVVIIEDFDKYQKSQGGDMKRWLDRYSFQAPFKGGYMIIRPRMIIVTSQYRPHEIWDDPKTVSAIERRVTYTDFNMDCVSRPQFSTINADEGGAPARYERGEGPRSALIVE